jgi:dihydrofolate reductase
MSRVIADITMSLDGFVTGPGADVEHGLGLDADGLHAWALESTDPVDRDELKSTIAETGAVLMGRKTFDTVDAPSGWNDELGYGADQDARPPFFVVTSTRPDQVRLAQRMTSPSCWTALRQLSTLPGEPQAGPA